MENMVFTDSRGLDYDVRHVVGVSKRSTDMFYETNDGTWYSHDELQDTRLAQGDIILTSTLTGNVFTMKLEQFNFVLALDKLPKYSPADFTEPKKPLPKGL